MNQKNKNRLFFLLLAVIAVGTVLFSRWTFLGTVDSSSVEVSRVRGGTVEGGIPAIDTPIFERPLFADQYLKNDGLGLDVEINGEHRFYPYQILVWHEVVNDTFEGKPLLVTFSPLGFLGAVYERSSNGATFSFASSEFLQDNLALLKDREAGSFWLQATGEGVEGPGTGTRLAPYPSHVMMWSEWKSAYPDGEVLSRETGFERDYTRDPYADYYPTDAVWFPLSIEDTRMRLKEPVYGVRVDGMAKAYPSEIVEGQSSINDTIGNLPIRLVRDEQTGLVRAFRKEHQENADELPVTYAFWFAWSAAHPETELYLP